MENYLKVTNGSTSEIVRLAAVSIYIGALGARSYHRGNQTHNNRDSEEVGMERATPVELRRSMEAADAMKDSGLRFVPMPVIGEEDHKNLVLQMYEKLAKIAELCDDE